MTPIKNGAYMYIKPDNVYVYCDYYKVGHVHILRIAPARDVIPDQNSMVHGVVHSYGKWWDNYKPDRDSTMISESAHFYSYTGMTLADHEKRMEEQ